MAITGFDDIPIAEHAAPPLTTVHQPIYEIGRKLAHMLVNHIESGQPEQHLILPAEVIKRTSVNNRNKRG
jgi:DNA-binding LacI/PurR family transcriptional regulator